MKAKLYQTASDYCAGQQKIVEPINFNSYSASVGVKDEAELTFRCIPCAEPAPQDQ